jgi:hypothetical protein
MTLNLVATPHGSNTNCQLCGPLDKLVQCFLGAVERMVRLAKEQRVAPVRVQDAGQYRVLGRLEQLDLYGLQGTSNDQITRLSRCTLIINILFTSFLPSCLSLRSCCPRS